MQQKSPAGSCGAECVFAVLVRSASKVSLVDSRMAKRPTGDLGVFDDRGYLFLRDRLREVIITGGFNIYPSDVEILMSCCPAIAECAIIGIADERWGEAVEVKPGMKIYTSHVP